MINLHNPLPQPDKATILQALKNKLGSDFTRQYRNFALDAGYPRSDSPTRKGLVAFASTRWPDLYDRAQQRHALSLAIREAHVVRVTVAGEKWYTTRGSVLRSADPADRDRIRQLTPADDVASFDDATVCLVNPSAHDLCELVQIAIEAGLFAKGL